MSEVEVQGSERRPVWLRHPWYIRFWQRCMAWGITLEGEVAWWAGNDRTWRKRKLDIEVGWPQWLFRPICWLTDGHDRYYDECVICAKDMR